MSAGTYFQQLDRGFAAFCKMTQTKHDEHGERVYVKVVGDVLRRERFTSIGDLVEAVKRECVRLRLPYASGQVERAIAGVPDQIARTIPILSPAAPEPPVESRPLTRDEAAAAYRRFVPTRIKIIPPPTLAEIDPRAADRHAAVLDEIAASIARCEQLERERPE